MYIVQLQYNPDGYSYKDPWNRVICGCEKEEDAFSAGQAAVNFYNRVPNFAGCGITDDNRNMFRPDYTFAVKEITGEWNPVTESMREVMTLERAALVEFVREKYREEYAYYCGFRTRSLLDITCDLVSAEHDIDAIDLSFDTGIRVW